MMPAGHVSSAEYGRLGARDASGGTILPLWHKAQNAAKETAKMGVLAE